MSDLPAHKKGMRTFASDFERAKGATPSPAVPSPQKEVLKKPVTILKPAKEIPAPSKSISKTIQKPAIPKKIPAFHEIEKSLGDIDLSGSEKKKKSPKPKHSKKGITPSKRVGGGAIITDNKTHSFSLFAETKKSISSWFKSRKKKAAPKLAVSKAERRKGVIQEATTKSGTIFTADNETLKERIKARKLQEQNKPHDPETNWSPYTETGYPLLESGQGPATDNVVIEFKKRSVPAVATPTPEPVAKPVIQSEPVSEVDPVEAVAAVAAKPAPETITTPASTEPEPAAREAPQPEAVAKEETVIEVDQTAAEPNLTEPVAVETVRADEEKGGLTTNQLTMYVSGGLALILATGFVGWLVMTSTSSTLENNGPQVERFVSQANTQIVTVDQTFTPATLRTFTGVASYSEIVLQNSDQESLPAALVFELVTPDMPTTIQQFSTDVRFVQFGSDVPQMMTSVVDPISVTGALLAHEAELTTALFPLYGQIDAGEFTDTSIAEVDARTLVSGNQQTLTYGIVNGETLVIAISPDAFAEISALIIR